MKIPEINYRAVAIIAIVVSVFGLVISPVSAAVSPSGTYIQGQHYGGNFLSNQTRIAAAAQTLGVSVSELTTALTPPSQGHFNLTNAAAQVSTASGTTITPTQLMTALGMHAGGMRTGVGKGQHYGGNFLSNQTRIAAAAQTLGVSVSELTTALTPPSQGHFNLTNVAAQVSTASGTTITPTQLMTALGMHAGGMRNSTQWKQGSSFRSYHAGFGNLTAQHARYPARGQGS